MGGLVEGGPGEFVAAAADPALPHGLAGLVALRRQAEMRAHVARASEAVWRIDGGADGARAVSGPDPTS